MNQACMRMALVVLLAGLLCGELPAEVVYRQVNMPVPVGSYYNFDLDQDGTVDLILRSSFLEGWCQSGDQDVWYLDIISQNGSSAVMAPNSSYAAALQRGVPVNAGMSFSAGVATMAELYWGTCGSGSEGQWLNVPDRYLGVQFRSSDGTHYGWAKVTTAEYIDGRGYLHSATVVSSFAYETVAGKAIATGQTTG